MTPDEVFAEILREHRRRAQQIPMEEVEAMMEAAVLETEVRFPTTCDEGCEVEPDACCPHGVPTVLRSLGLI